MDHNGMKQDQKRYGSFHFLPVLQGNKSLTYYSVLTHSLWILPIHLKHQNKKEREWFLARDARSKLKLKNISSEPIIGELFTRPKLSGKRSNNPMCKFYDLPLLYLYQPLFRDLLYNQEEAVDDTNAKIHLYQGRPELCSFVNYLQHWFNFSPDQRDTIRSWLRSGYLCWYTAVWRCEVDTTKYGPINQEVRELKKGMTWKAIHLLATFKERHFWRPCRPQWRSHWSFSHDKDASHRFHKAAPESPLRGNPEQPPQ